MSQRLDSVNDLAGCLKQGGSLYLSGCAAEIPGFEEITGLSALDNSLTISGIFLPGINRHDYTALGDKVRCQTYFMTPAYAKADQGKLVYCPWRYRDILRYYQQQAMDAAIVMLSSPDDQGRCSYGVTSDYAPLVLPKAGKKIGVINRQMPFIPGASIHTDELDVVLEIDAPLIETAAAKIDEVSQQIARNIAGFIEDGATLQLGLGSIPGAVATAIKDRKNLKIISGLIESSSLDLEAAGALCEQSPIIGGVALGDAGFYQALHKNPRVSFQSVAVTHDVTNIAACKSFVAVNGALEVDLFGQVNSCVMPRGYMSGPGGLPEFVAGALASEKGHSIIALPSAAKGSEISRIVPSLQGAMPSVSALDADVVVTEFGYAELRGKSLSDRVQQMIRIAHPEHQQSLREAARSLIV